MDPSLISSFNLKHDDFVHDVQYDYYGKRMATCSSDQILRIWERSSDLQLSAVQAVNQEGNSWVCTQQLGKHKGAVWRVGWADPEFGQILASCGND